MHKRAAIKSEQSIPSYIQIEHLIMPVIQTGWLGNVYQLPSIKQISNEFGMAKETKAFIRSKALRLRYDLYRAINFKLVPPIFCHPSLFFIIRHL